jgi:two-component system CheB/CheR fusion protein
MTKKKLVPAAPVQADRALLARGPPKVTANFAVVGIGASSGGLEALTKLVTALPVDTGMGYILVQHLDPTYESLLGDLLAEHSSMPVLTATDGMIVQRDHIYVIPEGVYLSLTAGSLHLSEPAAPRGSRMPIDFLLESMADERGALAIAIILSGNGTDGTLGIAAVHEKGGLVLVQDPAEADYDGMPQSAIDGGLADAVVGVAQMPDALLRHAKGLKSQVERQPAAPPGDVLTEIIECLRKKTAHNFAQYKTGTLQRRIERRMALASIPVADMARYLDVIQGDAAERDLLANDLLINVTGFFRDPAVFELLAKTIVPEIVQSHSEDMPLRVWVAGCSTGEEAYSLAMLFAEAIAEAKRAISCRCSPLMSIPMPWRPRARAPIPQASQRTFRPDG